MLLLGAAGIMLRAVDLQVLKHGFLAEQGAERFMRNAKIPAHRGAVFDRYGEPLAVSTPVDTVWTNSRELAAAPEQFPRLAKALSRDREWLTRRVTTNLDSTYLVLAKQLQPDEAARVKALGVPGVYLQREYRRFYPAGEVTGHLLGFTGADDQGQEGLELANEPILEGQDGIKRVIVDRYGRVVEEIDSVRAPRPGEDLTLSVDLRIQYLAYRELKSAIREFQARAGSVIVIDVRTGEVLAMVNQPSFNPNDRTQFDVARYRNRAATDIFEPGSSIKPFIVASGLASGKLHPNSLIDTNPGFIKVGSKVIEDHHNLGMADLATILAKSSNVGMAHIALSLDKSAIWETLNSLGFGQVSATGFPGESAGLLSHYSNWRELSVATLAYGYGVSVTPLQLAQGLRDDRRVRHSAAAQLSPRRVAAGGRARTRRSSVSRRHPPDRKRGDGGWHGTARRGARLSRRRQDWHRLEVDGRRLLDRQVHGGIRRPRAGASAPRLATVVVIDEPSSGKYAGGDVAAPVFSAVMAGALRPCWQCRRTTK